MENYQLKKVYTIPPVNLLGIREQRKGLLVPEENQFVKDVTALYSDPLSSKYLCASQHTYTPIQWINEVSVGNQLPPYKRKVVWERKIPKHFDGIRSLQFTKDGTKLLIGYGCGNIEVWPVGSEDNKIDVKSNCDKLAITSIRCIPNTDRFLASSLLGTVFVCTANNNDYLQFFQEEDNEINSLDVSFCGKSAVTGGKDACIRLYDIETNKVIQNFRRPSFIFSNEDNYYHSLRIFCVKFHPEFRNMIVSGGWDGVVKIWDSRLDSRCVINLRGPYICGDAIDIRDSSILTGSTQMKNGLKLWSIRTGKLIETISPLNRSVAVNGEFIYVTRFYNGDILNKTAIAGGRNPKFEIIDIVDRKVLCGFPVLKSVLAFDSNDKHLAFGGFEPLLRVVNCAQHIMD